MCVIPEENQSPIAIFKIGSKDHMEDLLCNGHVYMNPLRYFAKLESNSPKADHEEGTLYCMNAEGAKLRVQKINSWKTLGSIKGGIRYRNNDFDSVNIYCLHTKMHNDYDTIFQLKQLHFGDYYILFKDANEFMNRLKFKLNSKGHQVESGLVEYFDKKSYSGPMGIFSKFSNHSHEQEFRIAVIPGTGQPMSVKLGDISDIAIFGNCSDRLKLERRIG